MQEALAKLDQAKVCKQRHWTAGDPVRLVRWVASDFIAQLETKIEETPGFTHGELAKRLDVSISRVSQMMNCPGNFTLKNAVVYANGVDEYVALVVYPVNPDDNGAPISGDVFRACWEIAGRPKNIFDIRESSVRLTTYNGSGGLAAIGHTWGTMPDLRWSGTAQTDSGRKLIDCGWTETQTITYEGKSATNA